MKTISQDSINTIKPVLEKAIIALEFKKDDISNFFSEDKIAFIQAPINNTIQSIQKFLKIIENPINEDNILELELNDYLAVVNSIENMIETLNNTIRVAQLFNGIDSDSFVRLFDKVNKIQDSKYELVEMYNKVKWNKD